MCIGCRRRTTKSGLVRLVWDAAARRVVHDSTGTAPGRGAWVHPDPHCGDLAIRRRAVGRALRVPEVEAAQVASVLAHVTVPTQGAPPDTRESQHSADRPGKQKVGRRS